MRKLIVIIGILCLSITHANDFKFGKVTKEEVAEKQHPIENDARAAILYKKERTRYEFDSNQGWSLVTDVHYRIKIYDKQGFDWATIKIPVYVSNTEKEKVTNIKGYTFNLVNDKLVSEKLSKDGIFEEHVNENKELISITMPEVKEGSVLDIEYKITSTIYWYLDAYQFQYDIPVNQIDMKLSVPEYFIFNRRTKGFYPIDLKESVDIRKINVQYRGESDNSTFGTTSRLRMGALDFKENVYEVNATDMPSMVAESYTNNISNYRAGIKFELASTKFPNSLYKNYTSSWEDVAKTIYGYSGFGDELAKTGYFEKELAPFLAKATSQEEKIVAILNFVKSKMTWNGYNRVSCDDGVKKAFKNGVGNSAEINLMLTAMLKSAGLRTYPVLASTRSHGIPLFPTREGYNYVISAVILNDSYILLDATDKYALPNVLPSRVLNWEGRLITEHGGSQVVSLIPTQKSKKIHFLSGLIEADGSINGKLRRQYMDHRALTFRHSYSDDKKEEYLTDLESDFGGIEVSDFTVDNMLVLGKPVIETCAFYSEDVCEIIGDKLYFSPMLFLASTENPFKLDKREYPVDFVYPQHDSYMINLEIPQGYVVEALPEPTVIQLPEGYGEYKFNISEEENKITLRITSDLNRAMVPPHYYTILKDYFGKLLEKESEKVILVKT